MAAVLYLSLTCPPVVPCPHSPWQLSCICPLPVLQVSPFPTPHGSCPLSVRYLSYSCFLSSQHRAAVLYLSFTCPRAVPCPQTRSKLSSICPLPVLQTSPIPTPHGICPLTIANLSSSCTLSSQTKAALYLSLSCLSAVPCPITAGQMSSICPSQTSSFHLSPHHRTAVIYMSFTCPPAVTCPQTPWQLSSICPSPVH